MSEHNWNQYGSRRLMLDDGDGDSIEWTTHSASAQVGDYRLSVYAYGWTVYDTSKDGPAEVVMRGTVDGGSMEQCKRGAIAALRDLSPESRAAKLLERIEKLQAEHAALVGGAE